MKLFALDLHQDNVVVASMDCSEPEPKIRTKRCLLDQVSLGDFAAMLSKDDLVIMESTMNAFWVYYQIAPHVKSCYVLDTNAVHLRGNKTDALDARKLLSILSTFVVTNTLGQLPVVYVPTHEVIKLRSLFSNYRLLTKITTQLKNRIHGLYRQNGIVIEKQELQKVHYREKLLSLCPLEDYWREQVAILLKSLELNLSLIELQKKAILSFGLQLFPEEVRLLMTIPGFSAFIAVALMSDIADIARFPSSKKLCAYLRTAPSIHASNQTRHLGPVSKAGRSLTVTLLSQSVNHLKAASPALSSFYQRLRAGKNACKCRVALIRKTLTAAFYMLTRKTAFNAPHEDMLARKHRTLNSFLKGYTPPEKHLIGALPA